MFVAIHLVAKRNLLVHHLGSEDVEVCKDHHLVGRVDGITFHPRKKLQSRLNKLGYVGALGLPEFKFQVPPSPVDLNR